MRKLFLTLAVVALSAIPARAQDEYPILEIFGGYSYLSADTAIEDEDGDIDISDREGFHGAGFSFSVNLSRRFGFVGDFSYNARSISIPGIDGDVGLNALFFLFGPRVTARSDRVTGFGHALIGGVRTTTDFSDFVPNAKISETSFALGLGGGVDIGVNDDISVRAFQVDYLPVRASGDWAHNLRFQVGLVFKIQ